MNNNNKKYYPEYGKRYGKSADKGRDSGHGKYRKNDREDSETAAGIDPGDQYVEGRNAVIELIKTGTSIDKLFIQEGAGEGSIGTILKLAKDAGIVTETVPKERLDRMSSTGHHQGVIAQAAAFEYAEVDDMLKLAEEQGEAPFLILLDGIEDPHNLGAIIRSACQAGAHGVIIPKRRAVGLTATVARTSAGALAHIPVARVTNLTSTMEELKDKGLWFACAAMDGQVMYDAPLTGAIGLVIGNEGEGVSRLVREKCDFTVSIPMKGKIDSLNASVAAGILAYEVVRRRMGK